MAETIPPPAPEQAQSQPVITTQLIQENGHTYLLTLKDGVEVAREARTPPPARPDPAAFNAAAFVAAGDPKNPTAVSPNESLFELRRAVRWLVQRELARAPIP